MTWVHTLAQSGMGAYRTAECIVGLSGVTLLRTRHEDSSIVDSHSSKSVTYVCTDITYIHFLCTHCTPSGMRMFFHHWYASTSILVHSDSGTSVSYVLCTDINWTRGLVRTRVRPNFFAILEEFRQTVGR